jgi:hypothetical protein
MDRDRILARITELEAQADKLKADLNAVGGALQDCQFWLSELDAAPADAEKQ